MPTPVFKALSIMLSKKASLVNRFLRFMLCAIVCSGYLPAAGQKDTGATLTEIGADTTTLAKPKKLREVMEELGERARENNIQKYKESRNAIRQADIIGQIKKITLQAGEFVSTSIDTATIWKEYKNIDSLFNLAGDGIFTKVGTIQSQRDLTISYRIISVLLDKSKQRKEEVDKYGKQLASYKFRLDSLTADSVLYELPADSATFSAYLNTLFLTVAEIAPADSAIQRSIENVQGLQVQLTLQVGKLSDALEKIDADRAAISTNTFKREFVNIWTPVPGTRRPLGEIMEFSKQKNLLALSYYAKNNVGKIALSILVIIALSIFLRTLKRKLLNKNELRQDFVGHLVFRHPVFSAIFIGVNLLQFLFEDPPFIFGMIFWIISALCLTIIFWGHITKFSIKLWLAMSVLFVLACFNNLILQASRQERWWMLVLAIAGVFVGMYFLLRTKRNELKEKGIIYFICFVVLLEFLALLFNVFGRYNVSKTLFTSGYVNVIIGIEFLWTARLLHEMLLVASRFYSRSEKKLLYYNFEKVGYKVPVIFYLLLLVGWFVLFARNFYSFRLITDPLKDMLVKQHTIGNYSFTVSNLLVFVVIMALATFLSKIVSFFASDRPGTIPDKNSAKSKMGSWVLLIRITIISSGLFIAAAAAGIPMDRITIILGALGVGIGFGLQELTNSLVSGIIIAFEKPVNVGDIVEVAEQSGTMKSIGIRSSVITSLDGADVIIPNGTLLSSNLINWTMSDEKRRVKFEVQLVMGNDLKKVKKILLDLLNADERILKQPAPSVELVALKNNVIDLHIYFWVVQVQYSWMATRSDLILEIDRVFKENNIAVPLPDA